MPLDVLASITIMFASVALLKAVDQPRTHVSISRFAARISAGRKRGQRLRPAHVTPTRPFSHPLPRRPRASRIPTKKPLIRTLQHDALLTIQPSITQMLLEKRCYPAKHQTGTIYLSRTPAPQRIFRKLIHARELPVRILVWNNHHAFLYVQGLKVPPALGGDELVATTAPRIEGLDVWGVVFCVEDPVRIWGEMSLSPKETMSRAMLSQMGGGGRGLQHVGGLGRGGTGLGGVGAFGRSRLSSWMRGHCWHVPS